MSKSKHNKAAVRHISRLISEANEGFIPYQKNALITPTQPLEYPILEALAYKRGGHESAYRQAVAEVTKVRMGDYKPTNAAHWYSRAVKAERNILGKTIVPELIKLLSENNTDDIPMVMSLRRTTPIMLGYLDKIHDKFTTPRRWDTSTVLDIVPPGMYDQAQRCRLHVSTEDPAKVAYYKNITDIAADIQTRTTLGRWMSKVNATLDESERVPEYELKRVVERYLSRLDPISSDQVQFVENTDPDGWERVYAIGPHSCMRGSDTVRIYAREGNYLRLAYATPDNQPLDEVDTVLARAIVREDTKEYVRIYPNPEREDTKTHTQFEQALQNLGYTEGDLNGIKLAYIEQYGEVVAPYLDGCYQSADMIHDSVGPGLVICDGGEFELTNTGGTATRQRIPCDCCGDNTPEDEITEVYGGYVVCSQCLNDEYISARDRFGDGVYISNDSNYITDSGGTCYVDDDAARANGVRWCEDSLEYESENDIVYADVGSFEGEHILVDNASRDEVTEEVMHVDDGMYITTPQGDELLVWRGYVRQCAITGHTNHISNMKSVQMYGEQCYIDPARVRLWQIPQQPNKEITYDESSSATVIHSLGQSPNSLGVVPLW